MLLILLIAVPVGIGLAIVFELLDHHGEHVETWIEDAHPLFARPTALDVTAPATPHLRLTGNRARASMTGTAPVDTAHHRRAA